LEDEEVPVSTLRDSRFQTVVSLRDGTSIRIRAIRADDKQLLLGHFSRLSAQSVYRRFLGIKTALTPEDLTHFTELDFVDSVGLVATLGQGDQERIVGVGRYFADTSAPGVARRAEMAFAVEDAHPGRGIAPRLLEQLLLFARDGEIAVLEADMLADNVHMLHVFQRMGFTTSRSSCGIIRVSLPLSPTHERKSA
jgi:GNAT superfamily N-acetyltransferase